MGAFYDVVSKLKATNDALRVAAKATVVDKLDVLTDEEVAAVAPVFDQWTVGQTYAVGDIRRDPQTNELYRCLQGYTAYDPNHIPSVTPSLWTKVRSTEVISEWAQPSAENPYMTGDKVTFNGGTYESVINNNVWSPAAYPQGWRLI